MYIYRTTKILRNGNINMHALGIYWRKQNYLIIYSEGVTLVPTGLTNYVKAECQKLPRVYGVKYGLRVNKYCRSSVSDMRDTLKYIDVVGALMFPWVYVECQLLNYVKYYKL